MDAETDPPSAAADQNAESGATVGPGRRWRPFRLSSPWRGLVERTRWLAVAGALFAVAILLLSSTVPVVPPASNSHARVAGSSNPSTPQSAFLPYVLNTSQYPLPDTLLNSTANISHPQMTEVSYLNQSIYEVTYLQTDIHGNSTLEYLYGRYQPHLALCILNGTGCSAANRTNLPIQWTSETPIFSLGSAFIQGTAIGSAGSLSAIAVSSNNQTRLFFAGDFGQVKTWNNPTPIPIPGISPRIAVSPSTIVLTTVSASALYITTFHLPVQNPLTPLSQGGGGLHGPLISTPTVTSVSPYWGPPGTLVNVYGTNFVAPATVFFGTHGVPATVLSSTLIQANAPSFPSTSPVNVTVQTSAGTSPVNWPIDLFEITSGPPPTPLIFSVVPNTALPNSSVNITGFGFTPSMQLTFGGTPALSFTVTGDNFVTAIVPWGVSGPFDVQVVALGVPSVPGPTDRFTFAVSQATEPKAVAGSPVLLNPLTPSSPPTIGVLATNSSSSTVVFYNSTNGGSTFRSYKTSGAFSVSSGSSLFNQVGASRIFVGGGISGQEATVGFGNTIFALFTTNLGNRTVVETEGSSDGGHTWTGPYASAPLVGTVRDPYATISPEGYVYVTWLENGAGPWQVDQVVYTESGRLLQAPQVIAGSGGPYGSSAFSPSVTVDGLARPLFLWGWYNFTVGGGVLRAAGAFVNASTAIADLTAAFHQTQPSDYIPSDSVIKGWPANLSAFQATVNTSLALVQNDISRAKAPCTIETDVVTNLFPKLTTIVPRSVMYGEANGCGVRFGASTTQIANDSGPLSADMYLGVYGEWLAEATAYGKLTEPYWVGAPSQNSLYTGFSVPRPPLYLPPDQAVNASAWDYHISVNPLTVNPNTIYLNVTTWFDSEYSFRHNLCDWGPPQKRMGVSDSDTAVYANETVIINGGAGGTFHPGGWAPSVYVTNLTANTTGTYEVELAVTYRQYESAWNQCLSGSQYNYNNKVVLIWSGWPTSFTKTLTGNFTTFLETVPEGLVVHEVGNKTTQGSDFIAWNNSMLATERTSVTGPGYSNSSGLGNTTFQVPENTGRFYVPLNQWYNATTTLTSEMGGINVTGWPIRLSSNLNAGHYSTPEGYTVGCQFHEVANPVKVTWLTRNNVTNVTTSGATLTWYSNVPGTGWARYNDSQEGVYTVTATMTNESKHPEVTGYPYRYTVQVHGLSPWAWYRVTVGVSSYSGCLEYDNGAVWYIHVLSIVPLLEYDFAYDSITQQGGGAQFSWSIPSAFAAKAVFRSGFLTYCLWNTSKNPVQCDPPVLVPLSSMEAILSGSQFTYYSVNSTFTLNITHLQQNATYNASVFLNFTLFGRWFNASSRPTFFTYERDTSGDGLTDWEKLRGWEVTFRTVSGWTNTFPVTANPSLYATNGLTNDFLEKEYALNPGTVDTAGSHMLDMYNLTFDLGSTSSRPVAPPGAKFHYWNENGSYDPFTVAQYPGGPKTYTVLTGHTNLSDNSPWASEVFWPVSSLRNFVNLSGVQSAGWLRAVYGYHGTERTLTVEGKLSWGANPLAASTPSNGIADGSRVNPLFSVQLEISSLNAQLTSCPSPPSGGAYGWAALFYLNYSTPGGPAEVANYSTEALDSSSGCGSISNYQVAIPINGTSQNQSLQVRVLLNQSSSSSQTNLVAERISSSNPTTVVSIVYDTEKAILNSQSSPYSYSGTDGSISFSLSTVAAGEKNQTFLWVPTTNTTLGALPWGLKRYVGEQSFDLVVVNASSGFSSDAIPYAQNMSRSYQLALTPGLNNFLIPREQFTYSVLGQAILLDRNTSLSSGQAPPLLGSAENTSIAYGSTNALMNLGCYWQNLAIQSGSGTPKPICNGTGGITAETGTSLSSGAGIVVVDSPNASGINVGGMPSEPALEGNASAGSALQMLVTFNLTSQTQFDLLLAALLDNVTGGVNGTFLGITSQVTTLGLNPAVTDAIANATLTSDGLHGIPWGVVPPPPPPSSGIWGWVTNTFSGIVSIGLAIVSVAWSAVTAVATFINQHIPPWLKALGAAIVSRAVGALEAVGSFVAQVLSAFLVWLAQQMSAFLSAVFAPLRAAETNFGNAVTSAFLSANATVNSGGTLSHAQLEAFWMNLTGNGLFLDLVVFSTAVMVTLVVLGELSIGEGFLLNILVTVIIAAVLAASSQLIGMSSALSGFGYTLEWAAHNALVTILNRNCSWPLFHTMGALFSIPSDLFSAVMGLGLLAGAYALKPTKVGDYATDLVLGALTLILDTLSAAASAAKNAEMALIYSISSAVLGTKVVYDTIYDSFFRKAADFLPGLRNFELFSDVLGTSGEAIGVAQLIKGC